MTTLLERIARGMREALPAWGAQPIDPEFSRHFAGDCANERLAHPRAWAQCDGTMGHLPSCGER